MTFEVVEVVLSHVKSNGSRDMIFFSSLNFCHRQKTSTGSDAYERTCMSTGGLKNTLKSISLMLVQNTVDQQMFARD